MVFLTGDHTLDINITVANITRLTMCGQFFSGGLPTVVCNGSVGISFTNMVDFKMQSLAITSCSRSWSYDSHPVTNSALHLQSALYTELVNCSFHGNFGTAVAVYTTSITLTGNNFTQNCESKSYSCTGGGISALNSNLTFIGNTTLLANQGAAGIHMINCILHATGSTRFIHNTNSGIFGLNSNLDFSGNTTFHASQGSSGIYIINCTLYATGNICFTDNSNGGISAFSSNLVFLGNTTFLENKANQGAAGIYLLNCTLNSTGDINFIHNSNTGSVAGAICAKASSLHFTGTSNFISNSASVGEGGAIYATASTLLDFTGSSTFRFNSASFGGAVHTSDNSLLRFNGTSNFTRNSVQSGDGGAIYTTTNTLLHFNGISHFSDNFAQISGGAIYTLSNTTLSFTGTSNFDSNFAMQGGAIFAKSNNTLTFDGSISFTNNGYDAGKLNTNTLGGGMYLDMNSTFSIVPNTTIHWENNHARLGGAIYADDNHNPFIYCNIIDAYKEKTNCFFQLPGWNLSNTIDVHLVFKNNFADVAGSVLYGGAVDHCKLTGLESRNSGEVFNKIVHIDDENTTSSISSLPFHICPCDEHHSDCSTSHNRF